MTKSPSDHERPRIGWCEYIDLPEWHISGLRAKADTGARSSSLHVENLVHLPRHRVAFDVILSRARRERRVHVVSPIVRESRVRSSNGESAERIFVRTLLRLGPHEREIEVNLVDRGEMLFRMLLGRSALSGLLVDASSRYALGRRQRGAVRGPHARVSS